MKLSSNQTTEPVASKEDGAYARPEITDYGTLRELTAGNKNASAPDQIVACIPAAFSQP